MGALISNNIGVRLLSPGLMLVAGLALAAGLKAQGASSAAEQPVTAEESEAAPVAIAPVEHTPLPGEPGSAQDKRI